MFNTTTHDNEMEEKFLGEEGKMSWATSWSWVAACIRMFSYLVFIQRNRTQEWQKPTKDMDETRKCYLVQAYFVILSKKFLLECYFLWKMYWKKYNIEQCNNAKSVFLRTDASVHTNTQLHCHSTIVQMRTPRKFYVMFAMRGSNQYFHSLSTWILIMSSLGWDSYLFGRENENNIFFCSFAVVSTKVSTIPQRRWTVRLVCVVGLPISTSASRSVNRRPTRSSSKLRNCFFSHQI